MIKVDKINNLKIDQRIKKLVKIIKMIIVLLEVGHLIQNIK